MEGGGKGSGAVPEAVMEAVRRTSLNMSEFKSQFVEFLSLCEPDVLAELPPLQRAKSLLLLAKATTTLFTLRLRCSGIHPDDHAVKSEIERLSLYQDKLERFIDLSKGTFHLLNRALVFVRVLVARKREGKRDTSWICGAKSLPSVVPLHVPPLIQDLKATYDSAQLKIGAPLRPSTSLNYRAATRFIEHSLPDLTPDQRRSMRDISKGEGPKMKYLERAVHKKRKCQSSEKPSVRAATQEFLEKAARELLGDNRSGIKGPLQPNTLYEHEQSSD